MSNLLHAGIIRYLKSIVFWVMLMISLIFGFITGAIIDSSTDLQNPFFLMFFLITAIQISLIIGTEFNNGIVRNKLIAGHGKSTVFISELLLSLIFSTALIIVFYGAFIVFNIGWFGTMTSGDIVLTALGVWLMYLSFAAVCTAVCFFIPYNSAVAAVVNIILVIAMAFGVTEIRSKFNEPEFNFSHFQDENGEWISVEEKNPEYIPPDSAKYAVLHAAYYLMPCGQLYDYQFTLSPLCNNKPPEEKYFEDLKTAPLHSLATIGLCAAAGLVYFRRKNLK